ncbi:MAG: prolyl oligopeptidase family serine peptidase [Planctomycetota bacterium]|nr:prolyl oligopeptidase family serine peptidase [Planctomycetota bacterium]
MGKSSVAPYGSWASPIKAADIAAGTIRLGEPYIEGQYVYWVELRPSEAGRCVVVRRNADGDTIEMNPPPFNARTRVHEYGGGAYIPHGETVIFANYTDQRLYRTNGNDQPTPITPQGDVRYADFVYDLRRRRLLTVMEDHRGEGEAPAVSEVEPVNTIAAVYDDGKVETLVSGGDFYANPRISPDGKELAWLTWNHPDMPWDAAEVWVGRFNNDGSIGETTHVAGGADESVVQPEFSPDGQLYFVSDRTDWWNLYRRGSNGRIEAPAVSSIEPVTQLEAEFAAPLWVFGRPTYAFAGHEKVVCTYTQNGLWELAILDIATGRLERIETPYNSISALRALNGQAVFIGGSSDKVAAIVLLDMESGGMEELRRASELQFDSGYISPAEAVEFPTGGRLTAYGLFYRPRNKDFTAPVGEKPPLVVMVHGGPTSAAPASLKLSIQYYTSRGIAVLDVNYGGSSGYGRKYRNRLNGQWGVVDVDDCCNGAKYLAEQGLVDPSRLAITGGSAGGYTTLAALAFRDTFAAGASHYGVSDCEALAKETHKFESRYLDGLIGPYPQRRDLYIERSAIHHLDGFDCPVIFFQGDEDKIVPPNQAHMMVEALRSKGVPVAYVEFAGEQHGFRQVKNITRALEGELYFFSRIFGFDLAEAVERVEIENL